jgi:hypothetical protein
MEFGKKEDAMVSNRRTADFDGADFYPTPHWATKALCDFETFNGSIWEPCCGEGDISMVLSGYGRYPDITSSDLFDRGFGYVMDAFENTKQYDNIITNPPYAIAEKLLEHFVDIYNQKMAMLVRTAFLESKKRYDGLYKDNPPARVYVFSQRVSMYPKGYEIKSGGTTSYSWIVWDKQHEGPTELKWIPPKYDKKWSV